MNSSFDAAVDEVAIAWALRHVDGTMDFGQIEAFADWLGQDPRHAVAFDRAMDAWGMLEAPRFEPEILTLRSEALVALRRVQRRRWRSFLAWRGASSATRLALAAACLAVVAGAGLYGWLAPDHYQTGVGERRVVALADGSKLALDAQTSVLVNYRADGRHLTLQQGRASFTVAKDPLHPFSVNSHGSVVVATGTQFSMEWLGDQTRVVLYEGHVAVLRKSRLGTKPSLMVQNSGSVAADTLLTAGSELVVPDDAAPARMRVLADPHAERAWEQGQIDLVDEPLGMVAIRMNRYLNGPQLLVAADARDMRISGLFNAGDLDAFVSGITRAFPIVAEQQTDGSFCLARQSNSSRPCR